MSRSPANFLTGMRVVVPLQVVLAERYFQGRTTVQGSTTGATGFGAKGGRPVDKERVGLVEQDIGKAIFYW